METWIDINDMEGYYKISTYGRVMSVKKKGNKILTPAKSGKGYLMVNIKGNCKYVHRLVAIHFIPNPDNKPQVNHLNGVKTINYVDNLVWSTPLENIAHAFDTGLKNSKTRVTIEAKENIRKMRSNGVSIPKMAVALKLHESQISRVIKQQKTA